MVKVEISEDDDCAVLLYVDCVVNMSLQWRDDVVLFVWVLDVYEKERFRAGGDGYGRYVPEGHVDDSILLCWE
jgi:hypothetical protein